MRNMINKNMNNPECKICGILYSTVKILAPFYPKCVKDNKHDFGDIIRNQESMNNQLLYKDDNEIVIMFNKQRKDLEQLYNKGLAFPTISEFDLFLKRCQEEWSKSPYIEEAIIADRNIVFDMINKIIVENCDGDCMSIIKELFSKLK